MEEPGNADLGGLAGLGGSGKGKAAHQNHVDGCSVERCGYKEAGGLDDVRSEGFLAVGIVVG